MDAFFSPLATEPQTPARGASLSIENSAFCEESARDVVRRFRPDSITDAERLDELTFDGEWTREMVQAEGRVA